MESYPRQAGALITVVAVEGSHVVVADADGIRHRARCTQIVPAGRGSRSSRVTCASSTTSILSMASRWSSVSTRWGSGMVPSTS